MKLTVLGSGTFFVDSEVSASAFILRHNDKNILIDCGPGTLSKLSQAGYTLDDIDYIFITHYHPDHTSDLFPLFMNIRLYNLLINPDNPKDFPIFYGPDNFHQFMLDMSNLTELKSVAGCDRVEFNDFTPEFEIDDIKVKTYAVVHTAFKFQCRGYAIRFEVDGKVVAFSGDTADCEGVRNVAKDADLFICDTALSKGKPNTVHLNAEEVGIISRDCNVKRVVLDHFYPNMDRDVLVQQVAENFDGDVIKAKDLDVIDI